MSIRWQRAFRYPQTAFLLVGTAFGFIALGVFTGFRPVALLVGAVIAIAMLLAWFRQFQRDRVTTTGNLLERTVMLDHVDAIAAKYPGAKSHSLWPASVEWALDSQAAAAAIAEREPTLVPDLLEALYTVEGLIANISGSIAALEQVQTEQYRTLTQQQLNSSGDQLKATCQQLQGLRDQIVLAQLTTEANDDTVLPARLQLLIDANKTMLQSAKKRS